MPDAASRLRAWAELTRISNLPTCVSNVLVGCALGVGDDPLSWLEVAAVCATVAAFYVGGMALNDVLDARIDATERPGRPIPSGRISRTYATMFVVSALAIGLVACAAQGVTTMMVGAVLSVAIVAYNWLHRRAAASAVLMGASRGLVYLLAASAVGPLEWAPPLLAMVATMTIYVTLLTWIARSETGTSHPASREVAIAMVIVVLLPIVVLRPDDVMHAFAGGLLMTAWLLRTTARLFRRQGRLVPVVLGFLAGISLVDAFFLTLLDQPGPAVVAIACFAATTAGHRRILGT